MDRLRRARAFLLFSLLTLGSVAGLTLAILAPDGPVRARHTGWGPDAAAPVGDVRGVAADRRGAGCGLERVLEGEVVARLALPGCRSYQAPSVVLVGRRTIAVWEHRDDEIAVSEIAPPLRIGRTLFVPRPTQAGALLPRTAVRADAQRLAIWYHGARVLSVGDDLSAWPGGAAEVAGARMGPRAIVVIFGTIALLVFYLVAASWRIALPGQLRRADAEGRSVTVRLPARGHSMVLDGHAAELDLSEAQTFGASLDDLAGQPATLILRRAERTGDSYRRRDRFEVAQVWAGDRAEALALARAGRAVTVALAVLASSILVLGLDAYLAL